MIPIVDKRNDDNEDQDVYGTQLSKGDEKSARRRSNPRQRPHHRTNRRRKLARTVLLASSLLTIAPGSTPTTHAKKSIPRSSRPSPHRDLYSPPWNPSPKIDANGFLTDLYSRTIGEWERDVNIGGRHGPRSSNARSFERVPVVVRQVPGDGNCLFHSITVGLSYVEDRKHLDLLGGGAAAKRNGRGVTLRERSAMLRKEAVDTLDAPSPSDASARGRSVRRPRERLLFLQGREYLTADELLQLAASQYNLTGEEYCKCMRKEGYWGGGPEIVALSNALRRPIHVYELTDVTPAPPRQVQDVPVGQPRRKKRLRASPPPEFRLRRLACFGSPRFDNKEPIHILSADSRFPDLTPGRQASTGNHFLAIFPGDRLGRGRRRGGLEAGVRVRSGGGGRVGGKIRARGTAAHRRNDARPPVGKRRTTRETTVTKEKGSHDEACRPSVFAQMKKQVNRTGLYWRRVLEFK